MSVAAPLDGASDAYDKAQRAVQGTRDAWVNGEDWRRERPYRPRRMSLRILGLRPDCGNERPIECDCAYEENPDVDKDEFAEDLLDKVDDRVACGKAVPEACGRRCSSARRGAWPGPARPCTGAASTRGRGGRARPAR